MRWSDMALRREKMERRIREWKRGSTPPARGWLRELREVMGLPAHRLAKRLKVTQAAITALEKTEVSGAARLKTLQKAAKAMGCEFYYMIAPPPGLTINDALRKQARDTISLRTIFAMQKAGFENAPTSVVSGVLDIEAEKVLPKDVWHDGFNDLVQQAIEEWSGKLPHVMQRPKQAPVSPEIKPVPPPVTESPKPPQSFDERLDELLRQAEAELKRREREMR